MDAITTPARIKAGRPTREQAEARLDELLEAALDHFLDKGFEQATIEAIASSVSMTKRTVYARFPDKVALFRAAVRRAIEQLAVSPEEIRAARTQDIAETLRNLAMLRVRQAMTPAGVKLQRIVNTESYRFPDIFMTSYELGALPVMQFIAEVLADETRAGRLAVEDPHLAANLFITFVVSGPVRIAVSGNYLPEKELQRRVDYAIHLFLDGARPR
ncbi:MAG: TetR/AcrR family transcriptional regulator [Sphingomonadales bacterium]|nr:TetR/AcrR family transcriptional regulator [Sphingomonadales bacterium]